MTVPTAKALDWSEQDLQRNTIDMAKWCGWRVAHFRPARTANGWRTPVEGDAGLPDLVLARGGVVLLAELKSGRGALTDDQRRWLAAAGSSARLWRPCDWPEIVRELSRKRADWDA